MSVLDIKDRIPTNVLSNEAVRYGVYDEEGELLRYEYMKREDEPIEEGTPINKVLLDNFQGDLYTRDRYNSTQVNKEDTNYIHSLALPLSLYEKGKAVNIECGRIVDDSNNIIEIQHTDNIFAQDWQSSGSSFITTDGFKLYAMNGAGDSSNAVDEDENTYWESAYGLATYVYVSVPEAIKITKMKIKDGYSSSSGLRTVKIQGSNDGETWEELYSSTSVRSTLTEISLTDVGYYTYYRIYYNFSSQRYAYLYEWQVAEYYTISDETQYIETFDNPYININNLGNKLINGTINYGKKYELVYNGESWDIINPQIVAGSFVSNTAFVTVNVGFTPDLVICYSASNNNRNIGGSSTNSSRQYEIPRILTKAYFDVNDHGKIITNGFTHADYSRDTTIYYVAIKFREG